MKRVAWILATSLFAGCFLEPSATPGTVGCQSGTLLDVKTHACEPIPCGGCPGKEACDPATNTCIPLPCHGVCTFGEFCGTDNKCALPCGGPCKFGQWCDASTLPGDCSPVHAPSSWGVGGDGKVQRVVSLRLTDKTQACDMNGDGKADNAFQGASSLITTGYQDAVKTGKIFWLFEAATWPMDGSPFAVNLLQGRLAPGEGDGLNAGHKVTIDAFSYDQAGCDPPGCPAAVRFADATVKAGTLQGTAGQLDLLTPIAGIAFVFRVTAVQLSADVSDATAWMETTHGRLCGYVTEADMAAAVDALPDADLQQFGGKDAVKKLVPTLIKSDVDSDGDGKADAKSISLDFQTLGAAVVGVTHGP